MSERRTSGDPSRVPAEYMRYRWELTPMQARVVLAMSLPGRTQAQVGTLLGITQQAVSKHLRKALAKARELNDRG